jgi:hypothetical protein
MPVESDVRLGHGVVIFHPELVNLYGCRIGDGTRIGSFVEIQKNATCRYSRTRPSAGGRALARAYRERLPGLPLILPQVV